MKIGVLCNDRWHPAEVVREGLEPLQNRDTTLAFFEATDDATLEQLLGHDVVVLSKGNGRADGEDHDWLTAEVQNRFQRYVENGGGLLVCHSGTVGYRDEPVFRKLVGGVFAYHPHHCPILLEYVGDFGHARNDPRTITIHDEHYFVETGDDIHVFLQASSENGTQPAGWTRTEGQGRVCVLTPGHFAPAWTHPVYQHTLRLALHWCSGEPGKVD